MSENGVKNGGGPPAPAAEPGLLHRKILAAAGDEPQPGRVLALRAGCGYDAPFRAALTDLERAGFLQRPAGGSAYRLAGARAAGPVPPPLPAPPEGFLSVDDVAALLRASTRTVWRMLAAGQLPEPVRLSKKFVRWRAGEVYKALALL